jgi:uroporphyrin-III C-methyltransferase
LLTLRAVTRLQQARIVLFDALVGPEVLAQAPHAQHVPVGKRAGRHSLPQSEINALLLAHASQGGLVVRLKGGDPTLFGRLDEEVAALDRAGIPFEIVSGVTSACAAAAALKRSLTTREVARELSFVTPSTADLHEEARFADLQLAPNRTTVFYMAGRLRHQLAQALLARGFHPDDDIALVFSASLPEQKVQWVSVAMLAVTPVEPHSGPVLVIAGLHQQPTDGSGNHVRSGARGQEVSELVMQHHLRRGQTAT